MRRGPPLPLLSKALCLASFSPPSSLFPFLLRLTSAHPPPPPATPDSQKHCLAPQGPDGADPAPTWLPTPTHASARTHACTHAHTHRHTLHQARKREPGRLREMAGAGGATPFCFQQLPIHSPLPSPTCLREPGCTCSQAAFQPLPTNLLFALPSPPHLTPPGTGLEPKLHRDGQMTWALQKGGEGQGFKTASHPRH